MTTNPPPGSAFLRRSLAIALLVLPTPLISVGCGAHGDAEPAPGPTARARATEGRHRIPTAEPAPPAPAPPPPAPASEAALGVTDRGIWSDLDDKIQIRLPADLTAARVSAQLDAARSLLVLSIDGFPRKVYPLGGPAQLQVGPHALALRPGDRAELAALLEADRISERSTPPGRRGDTDGDGIPDPLDLLIGAKKTVHNADAYTEGYIQMGFPNGDVPREVGVCTDVIIRAVRNAGIDLQKELYNDILRARASYPMIRRQPDPQIDQRRVATLLPYFMRHWDKRSQKIDDPEDPLRPGDVIFMDTFPTRSGPDHVGIVSDTLGPDGLPMIINNWTNGTVTAEMNLLTFVPVLYRFRLRGA